MPGGADLVTYWFEKARAQIEAGKCQRAGLVATNSIRGGANRKVLERIVATPRQSSMRGAMKNGSTKARRCGCRWCASEITKAPYWTATLLKPLTPGHTAYAVESEGQKLLIWGDLVHAHAVQFARPGVSIEFDIDQKQAIATRRSIMKAMAASKSLVAGMHLPFPGIGHVRAEGKGSYSWVPIEFAPLPKAD